MVTVSIRISEDAHRRLRNLAEGEHRPISRVAEEAINLYERERRWQQAEEAMARLRAKPEEYEDYLAEAAVWDTTLNDGLKDLPFDVNKS